MSDTLFMSRALALAERGRGCTSPNPMVGAVIVSPDGVVVGRGSHQIAGGPHAEIHALNDAGELARGATLYCTLEPCCHTGRTGPCSQAIIGAGVRRVVVAVEDPNPLVAGRGLAQLRDHGVEVSVGTMGEAAEHLNAPFFTVMRRRRPFVTMKVALSADGRVAAAPDTRTRLTGPAADRLIHRDRAETDAIAVGSGTALADDPLLTARGAYRVRPLVRVVFDRSLRLPTSARILSSREAGPILVVGAEPRALVPQQRADALAASGAEVVIVRETDSGAFLREALIVLAARGVTSLILEGGPTLHAAAWTAGVVDRVQMFQTPHVLGDGGVPWLDSALFAPAMLERVRTMRLGDDVMTEGYVHRVD